MQYYYDYYEYLLIVDPSDCRSPSTMVDCSLCAMYLSRYYVCISSQQRRCGAPSATSATGSAVMSLQESRKATVICRLSTKGVTAWQWCQELYARFERKKSLTCNRIPETVRGVFTGSVRHRHKVRQSDFPDYQNQLVDCSALVVSEIIWQENQPYRYDKARLILPLLEFCFLKNRIMLVDLP